MSDISCSPDDFSATLVGVLSEFSDNVIVAEKAAVDQVAEEVNDTIKEHITFQQHSGKYLKAFRMKTTEENAVSKKKTWYVKGPEYRLTHLLENGHALRQGGRTQAFPHIKYGDELAQERMMELSKEAVESAGR